jgi:hypothetical protein
MKKDKERNLFKKGKFLKKRNSKKNKFGKKRTIIRPKKTEKKILKKN